MSRKDGLLYFVQVENDGPVKVGYTGDLDCRLMTLQGWCPYKLSVLFALRVPQMAETYCLEILRPHKIRGEWFEPHPFVKTFIDQIRNEGRVPGCPEDIKRPDNYWKNKPVPVFDKIIPAIWPTRKALMEALGQKTLVPSYSGFSDSTLCRIIIAARKTGVNLKVSDLVKIKTDNVPRTFKQYTNRRGGRKPSKPRNDFLILPAPADRDVA